MYCQSCGVALTQQMRYCNRCGTQLVAPAEDSPSKTAREKRFDDYLDGLFWITVFGLGFVFGGMVVLKKIGLRDLLILGYMALSSIVFLINFGLSLWGLARIHRESKIDRAFVTPTNTSELAAASDAAALPPAVPLSSVTDNTTRSFDPLYVKKKID